MPKPQTYYVVRRKQIAHGLRCWQDSAPNPGEMMKILYWQQFIAGYIAACSVTLISAAYAGETVHIIAAPTPPHVIIEQDQAKGPALDMLQNVIRELGMQSVVDSAPNYGRGFLELSSGNADALVFCTQNAERDRSATFFPTATKATLNWYSKAGNEIHPDTAEFKLHTHIGAYLNSNTEQWLIDHGYREIVASSDFEALVKMLDSQRIPVVFTVAMPFESAMQHLGIPADRFQRQTQLERPFGFYFSHAWLMAHPGIQKKIQAAIIKFDYGAKH
jgi:hypothetical protein